MTQRRWRFCQTCRLLTMHYVHPENRNWFHCENWGRACPHTFKQRCKLVIGVLSWE